MSGALTRRLSSVRRAASERGVPGLVHLLADRLRSSLRRVRRWWYRDHAWIGRLVRLRGAQVRLDGCRFDVSHPLISDALRTRLVRGRYERSERALLGRWLDPAAPVVELGGGIGVVATLTNRRLHRPEQHVVVEANPALIPVIARQRLLNGAAFAIEHAAIAYSGAGTIRLQVGDEFIGGRVDGDATRAFEVRTLTLAELFARYPWKGATLVCDIEGLETELVEFEGDLLACWCRTLVIEVHPEFRSAGERNEMRRELEALDFELVDTVRKVQAYRLRAPS